MVLFCMVCTLFALLWYIMYIMLWMVWHGIVSIAYTLFTLWGYGIFILFFIMFFTQNTFNVGVLSFYGRFRFICLKFFYFKIWYFYMIDFIFSQTCKTGIAEELWCNYQFVSDIKKCVWFVEWSEVTLVWGDNVWQDMLLSILEGTSGWRADQGLWQSEQGVWYIWLWDIWRRLFGGCTESANYFMPIVWQQMDLGG